MKVDDTLRSASLCVLAGTSDTIDILEDHTTEEYSWCVYVQRGLYPGDWITRFTDNTYDRVFWNLQNNLHHLHDLEGRGFWDKNLDLSKAVVENACSHHHATRLLANPPSVTYEGDISLPPRHEVLNPFLGAYSVLPQDISQRTLAVVLMLTKNPTSLHLVVVGNIQEAKLLLGPGLERIRGTVLDYYNIRPKNSLPLDFPIPFIYSSWEDNPSLLEVTERQRGNDNFILEQQIRASINIVSTMHTIVSMDHGYYGIKVLDRRLLPRTWLVTTSSSSTPIPFRYPILVALLAKLNGYEKAISSGASPKKKDLVLNVLCNNWGTREHILSLVSNLNNPAYPSDDLYNNLPSLSKAFFIALYRATCRKVITFPSKKEYPLRTEASRLFRDTYDRYVAKCRLSDYIRLSEVLVSTSVLNAFNPLTMLSNIFGLDPYTFLLPDTSIPPLPLTGGGLTLSKTSRLFKHKDYANKVKKWTGVSVKTEWGVTLDVGEEIERATLAMLDEALTKLKEGDLYKLITEGKLNRLSGSQWCKPGEITPYNVTIKFLENLTLEVGVLKGVSMLSITWYHAHLNHPVTEVIIKTICKLITALSMDTYVDGGLSSGSTYTVIVAQLCVREVLEDYLNGGGV